MKKIAIILSGCGYKDGSETTEVISTLISVSRMGAEYQCFAPQIEFTATDHSTSEPGEARNTFAESARLCRGQIQPLEDLHSEEFDALILPGGFGAALHLCDWAAKGARATVLPAIEKTIQEFNQQDKPIGAMCIAPVLLAKVLGSKEITVTIGNDKETTQEIEKTGAIHEECKVDDFVTDRAHKIVTSPAYMYDEALPHLVAKGIDGLVKEVVEMA